MCTIEQKLGENLPCMRKGVTGIIRSRSRCESEWSGTTASERSPASHTIQFFPRSFIIFFFSHFFSLPLHRLFPRPPAQDDSEQFEDRSALTATRSMPLSPTSHSLFDLGTLTISLGRDSLTLVYPSHSILWCRLVSN
jgi:hypothetical protein